MCNKTLFQNLSLNTWNIYINTDGPLASCASISRTLHSLPHTTEHFPSLSYTYRLSKYRCTLLNLSKSISDGIWLCTFMAEPLGPLSRPPRLHILHMQLAIIRPRLRLLYTHSYTRFPASLSKVAIVGRIKIRTFIRNSMATLLSLALKFCHNVGPSIIK